MPVKSKSLPKNATLDIFADINIALDVRSPIKPLRIRVLGREPMKFSSMINTHELIQSEIDFLRRAILPISDQFDNKWDTPLDAGENSRLMATLISAGKATFNRVFSDNDARNYLIKALEQISQTRMPIIEIDNELATFSWELLVEPLSVPESTDINNLFWGTKYEIYRQITREELMGSESVISGGNNSAMDIGVLSDVEADSATEEIKFLTELTSTKFSVSVHETFDGITISEANYVRKTIEFLRDSYHIFHFVCEASYDRTSPMSSFFTLSSGIKFQLGVLDSDKIFKFSANPFIIFNACTSGQEDILHPHGFAFALLNKGAIGIIALETDIPGNIALEFTRHFYKQLGKNHRLGQIVIDFRKKLLSTGENPLGLAYLLFANPFLTFKTIVSNTG